MLIWNSNSTYSANELYKRFTLRYLPTFNDSALESAVKIMSLKIYWYFDTFKDYSVHSTLLFELLAAVRIRMKTFHSDCWKIYYVIITHRVASSTSQFLVLQLRKASKLRKQNTISENCWRAHWNATKLMFLKILPVAVGEYFKCSRTCICESSSQHLGSHWIK